MLNWIVKNRTLCKQIIDVRLLLLYSWMVSSIAMCKGKRKAELRLV